MPAIQFHPSAPETVQAVAGRLPAGCDLRVLTVCVDSAPGGAWSYGLAVRHEGFTFVGHGGNVNALARRARELWDDYDRCRIVAAARN